LSRWSNRKNVDQKVFEVLFYILGGCFSLQLVF
jgi:hypothetical protein